MRIKYHKEIEFFLKRFFFSEKFLLKRRLERAIKNDYEPEIKLVKEFIVKGTDSLDIGVYQGIYSYEISKYAKTVHAFEFNPIIFPFLDRNIYKIINNIKLYNFGLSNKNGKTTLRIPIRNKLVNEENYEEFFEMGRATICDKNEFNEFRTFSVNVKKLDNFQFENPISFIKIDVEGHELEVVEGAIATISRNKPILLVEIEERYSKKKVIDTIKFINSLGYKSYYFNKKELINTATLTNFDSYNNFIFKPT
jgi:FkbM family methyltransferase